MTPELFYILETFDYKSVEYYYCFTDIIERL